MNLKPCPFCGGEALGIDHPPHKHVIATFMPDHPGSYSVECVKCSVGLIAPTQEQAVMEWNKRASPSEADGETKLPSGMAMMLASERTGTARDAVIEECARAANQFNDPEYVANIVEAIRALKRRPVSEGSK